MKIRKNGIIQISVAVVLAILAYLILFVDFKNVAPKPPLPQKYKAYRELKLGKDSLFTISPFNADYYYSDQNQFIRVKENNYYKINADGVTIDSLKLNKDLKLEYESGYLLDVNFYYDWIFTGDTTKHKYVNIDSKNITTNTALATINTTLCAQAKFTHTIYHDYYAEESAELLDNYLFLINNKWNKLSVHHNLNDGMSTDAYYKYHDDRIKYFRAVDNNLALIDPFTPDDFRKDKSIAQIPYNVAYFDLGEYVEAVGNTMNNDHDAFWTGMAYINYAYGADTLKFKNKNVMLIDKSDWASWVKYERCPKIFAHKNVNFIIISSAGIDRVDRVMVKKNKMSK